MPRPPRIQYLDAHYHVYNRGNRREVIFRTHEDYQAFETFMIEAMNRSGVRLFNWNQLPNHFHFNLSTPEGNLSEFMQRLLSRYSRYVNRKFNLLGHLFQSRYGARLVDQEAYFKELIRYVELNVYRVKGPPLAPFGKWRWSSLHYLLQDPEAWPEGCRSAFQEVLETFHPDPGVARQSLLKFLGDGLADDSWQDFYRPKDGRFIGDDVFIERAKELNQEPIRRIARTLTTPISFEAILSAAERASGLTAERLLSPGKERVASRWRKAIIYLARTGCRIPVTELARRLQRRESAISMTVRRIGSDVSDWPESQKLQRALSIALPIDQM